MRISWPREQPRSSLKAWLIGAGVIGGAAIVAYGVQRVRSALGDATMHHRHHANGKRAGDDGLPADPSG